MGQHDKASALTYIIRAIDRRILSIRKHDGRVRIWMVQLEEWLVEKGHLAYGATIHEWRQEILTSWRYE